MEAFDTLAFANKLKAAGVPDNQAEAIAEVQADAFRGLLESSPVTKTTFKGELAGLRAELREDIDGLRAELRKELAGLREDVAGLRSELYKALLTQTFALIAAIAAAAGALRLFG